MEKPKIPSWFLCSFCRQVFSLRIQLKLHVERCHLDSLEAESSSEQNGQIQSDGNKISPNGTERRRCKNVEEKASNTKPMEASHVIRHKNGITAEAPGATGAEAARFVNSSPQSSNFVTSVSMEQHNGVSTYSQHAGGTAREGNKNGEDPSHSTVNGKIQTAGNNSPSANIEPSVLQRASNGHAAEPTIMSRDKKSTGQVAGDAFASVMNPMTGDEGCVKLSVCNPEHTTFACIEGSSCKQLSKCGKNMKFIGKTLKKERGRPRRCNYCPVKFISSQEFYNHIRSHYEESRESKHSAVQENQSFTVSESDDNNNEQRMHHELEQGNSAANHEESVRPNDPTHTPPETVLEPRNEEHDQGRPEANNLDVDNFYKCAACPKSFTRFCMIYSHVQNEHKVSEYEATMWLVMQDPDICSSFQAYTEHQLGKAEASLKCVLCDGKKLWERGNFWTHLSSFHGFSLGAAFRMSGFHESSSNVLEGRPGMQRAQSVAKENTVTKKKQAAKTSSVPTPRSKLRCNVCNLQFKRLNSLHWHQRQWHIKRPVPLGIRKIGRRSALHALKATAIVPKAPKVVLALPSKTGNFITTDQKAFIKPQSFRFPGNKKAAVGTDTRGRTVKRSPCSLINNSSQQSKTSKHGEEAKRQSSQYSSPSSKQQQLATAATVRLDAVNTTANRVPRGSAEMSLQNNNFGLSTPHRALPESSDSLESPLSSSSDSEIDSSEVDSKATTEDGEEEMEEADPTYQRPSASYQTVGSDLSVDHSHECAVCHRTFRRAVALQSHMRTAHESEDDEWERRNRRTKSEVHTFATDAPSSGSPRPPRLSGRRNTAVPRPSPSSSSAKKPSRVQQEPSEPSVTQPSKRKQTAKFQCPQCKYSVNQKWHFKVHLLVQHRLPHETVDEVMESVESGMPLPIDTIRPNITNWQCTVCSKYLCSAQSLRNHMKIHGRAGSDGCCGCCCHCTCGSGVSGQGKHGGRALPFLNSVWPASSVHCRNGQRSNGESSLKEQYVCVDCYMEFEDDDTLMLHECTQIKVKCEDD